MTLSTLLIYLRCLRSPLVPLVPLVRNSTLYTHPFPPQACAGNIHWLDNELTMPSSTVQVRIQDCLVPHIERPCIRYCHSCFSYKAITPAPRWAQIPQELRHRLVFVARLQHNSSP